MASSFEWCSVAGVTELGDLRREWDALARAHGWPLAETAWLAPAIRRLETNSEVRFWLLLNSGRLHGGIALAVPRKGPGAVARFPGTDALGEANVLLTRDDASRRALMAHLLRLGQPIALTRILDADHARQDVVEACGRRGKLVEPGSSGFPTLDIGEGLEAVLAQLSSNRRNFLRRMRRRLAEAGQLTVSSTRPNMEDIDFELAQFAELEDAGWKGLQGSSLLKRAGLLGFFADALKEFARDHRVRFDRLLLDGQVIAIQFGLVSGDRYLLLKPTYDESFADFSPGYLLTLEAIQRSIDMGLKHYDFLGANDPWKLHWTRELRDTGTWVFYPFNLRGGTAIAQDMLWAVGRRIRR